MADQALEGLRVVELGDFISARGTAKLDPCGSMLR